MKTFASLFTGGGLADIGAKLAGYELAWGIELEPAIAEVAQYNLKHRVHVASVIGFDWGRVDRVDHLHMSPPCQDFSVAKQHKSKRKLIEALEMAMLLSSACIEAIKALRPSAITLENVEKYRKPIFVDGKLYDPFNRIVDTLYGLGYWVQVDVLNAADFGVPQTRRRLILRAVMGGFPAPLPEPQPWRGWYQAIEDLIPRLPETKFAPWQIERLPDIFCGETVLVQRQPQARGDGIRRVNEPAKTYCSTDTDPKAFIVDGKGNRGEDVTIAVGDSPMFTVSASSGKHGIRAFLVPGGNANSFSVREGHEPSRTVESTERVGNIPRALLVESKNANQQYGDGLRDASEPCTTVITDRKPSHQPIGRLLEHGRVVRMTPRALARFQSVPDDYELPEKRQIACRIIGNGVPSELMRQLLEVTA